MNPGKQSYTLDLGEHMRPFQSKPEGQFTLPVALEKIFWDGILEILLNPCGDGVHLNPFHSNPWTHKLFVIVGKQLTPFRSNSGGQTIEFPDEDEDEDEDEDKEVVLLTVSWFWLDCIGKVALGVRIGDEEILLWFVKLIVLFCEFWIEFNVLFKIAVPLTQIVLFHVYPG